MLERVTGLLERDVSAARLPIVRVAIKYGSELEITSALNMSFRHWNVLVALINTGIILNVPKA